MVISYEEYHPYGTTAYWSASSAVEVSRKRYRYTGKEKDEETGLYYHGARYYAPWLGRWTAADPAGMVDGTDVFIYTHDNPIIYFDPTGTQQKHHGSGESVSNPRQAPPSTISTLKLALIIMIQSGSPLMANRIQQYAVMADEAGQMAKEGGQAVAQTLVEVAKDPDAFAAKKTKERVEAFATSYKDAGGGVEGGVRAFNQTLNPFFIIPDAMTKSTVAAVDAAKRGDARGYVRNGVPVLLFVGGALSEGAPVPPAQGESIVGSNGAAALAQTSPAVTPASAAGVAPAAGGVVLMSKGDRQDWTPNKPNRKKQGREAGEGKRKGKDWKPRNPPKEPPRHTPGKTHRKNR